MGVREVKVWRIACDVCRREGPTVFSEYKPQPPQEWGHRELHDCGMTGYSRTDLLCPECKQRCSQP